MSFNALSNVARRKNKVEKSSQRVQSLQKWTERLLFVQVFSPPPPLPTLPTLFQCWNITDHMRIEEYG